MIATIVKLVFCTAKFISISVFDFANRLVMKLRFEGVVENMACGNIMVAHNSGGPKMDILKYCDSDGEVDESKTVGYLADSPETYANVIAEIISLSTAERNEIRNNASQTVKRFDDEHFENSFLQAVSKLLA